MAFVLTDTQFEAVCERSELTCGHNCRTCEAFQANQRWHDGDYEDEDDEDEDRGRGGWASTHW